MTQAMPDEDDDPEYSSDVAEHDAFADEQWSGCRHA